jgi:two-component system LytT family response regulator
MDFSCQRDKTIILKEKGKVFQIAIEEIIYIKCEGYVSTLYTNNNSSSFSLLLKYFEEKVNGYGFCRINRNILVNLKYFDSYVAGKKRCFKTTTGIEMNVSRRKWCILKEIIEI